MSMRNFAQTVLALGLACQGIARAERPVPEEKPAVAMVRPVLSGTIGKQAQPIDNLDHGVLIDDMVGLQDGEPQAPSATGSFDEEVVACVALQDQPDGNTSRPSARRQGSGVLMGRIMGVNLDTCTLDVEFEGRRTTVGSQFSVNHDYPFSTDYLGNVEVIYLAGGNRVIAKPLGRADLRRMGKGDRVNGRIVAKKAKDGSGGTAPSGLPVPLPDVEAPYVPEDPARLDSPKPALDEVVQNGAERPSFAAKPRKMQATASRGTAAVTKQPAPALRRTRRASGPPLPLKVKSRISDSGSTGRSTQQPDWSATTAQSWSALLHTSRRPPQPGSLQPQDSRLATAAKVPAKRLWYVAKPTKVAAPSPVKRVASPDGAKRAAPSILLFEN